LSVSLKLNIAVDYAFLIVLCWDVCKRHCATHGVWRRGDINPLSSSGLSPIWKNQLHV